MGNKTSIGLGIAILLMVGAVVLRYGFTDSAEIEAAKEAAHQGHDHAGHDHSNQKENKMDSHTDHDHGHSHVNDRDVVNDDHWNQLSPEMKQAVKDKLLLHGPMESIQHPDGSIELPTNGRFTQMPVAVQMPDGSIQIREYSHIPE